MKILLLGGNGMAGHLLADYLRLAAGHEVTATVRDAQTGAASGRPFPAEAGCRMRALDARDLDAVAAAVREEKPDVIVNAVGVLNKNAEDRPLDAYTVNGLLPHWLAHWGEMTGARLIHISSDCVFSGDRGGYGEEELPDGTTVYAKSKALGEVRDRRHLTIRTSIIGPEIRGRGIGLLKWFLGQTGPVPGYANVWWNGVTTLELAKAIAYAIDHPEFGGLIHLTAPETISKLELLKLIRTVYNRVDITVVPAMEPVIDRTLLPTSSGFGYLPPDYETMLREMRERSSWG
ncbi:dTDP-4-dehydrorhamnose reductase family protein [Cohnella zeiphila]|uniref:dTDP-4-dehydrorhamnose reductase n=1 Tax=Cohnella zeiphila TaxID=2761120 RepID=A0A7X0VWN2_9BACL|nr:SDR family oxidoreductase [Cohnella zeiphila]MBB6732577.1 SDR family oxidoreductase [Cohnella zeiphila]